jgi:hypothetical protein
LPHRFLFMVGKAQKSHGMRSELNSVFGLEKVDQWNPIRKSAIQSRSRPMWFLGFFNHEKGAPRQEISKWLMVCSTFLKSRWSIVRSASLAKEDTLKKETIAAPPQSSSSVSPRTFQTTVVLVNKWRITQNYNQLDGAKSHRSDVIFISAWFLSKSNSETAWHILWSYNSRKSVYKVILAAPDNNLSSTMTGKFPYLVLMVSSFNVLPLTLLSEIRSKW